MRSFGFFILRHLDVRLEKVCAGNLLASIRVIYELTFLEFILNRSQFRARFVGDAVHPVSAAIPIAGVAKVAFHLVQHGMNPRGGGVVFVLLDELMRGVPFAGQCQFNRLEQFIFWRAHAESFNVELVQLARSLQITTPTVIDRRYNLCSICGWK
jgi:hypothetical protein